MKCNYCGQLTYDKGIYCPKCGRIPKVLKENNNGILTIRLDKIIPVGISIIAISVLVLLLIIFIKPNLFGLPVAISFIGITILAKRKSAIDFARLNAITVNEDKPENKCRYCYSQLYNDAQYCTFCGSKIIGKRRN